MRLIRRNIPPENSIEDFFFKIQDHSVKQVNALSELKDLVKLLRPGRSTNEHYAEEQLCKTISLLEAHPEALSSLRRMIFKVFLTSDISEVMMNSGMAEHDSVASELFRRLGHKLLPPLKSRKSMSHQIDVIFYKKSDYLWINAINDQLWKKFFRLIDLKVDSNNKKLRKQLGGSLSVLSYRLSSLGLENNIIERLGPAGGIDSAFVEQNKKVAVFLKNIVNSSEEIEARELLHSLQSCESSIHLIKRKNILHGTSMRETHQLHKLMFLIERMRLIIGMLTHNAKMEDALITRYFKFLVENEKTQNSIRSYFSHTVEELAYRISESGGTTGEHYIANTPKEHKDLLVSAAIGGAFVSMIATLKTIIHHFSWAPFWQSFGFGANYAAGFILLQANKGTLATKQPAMTASTVASTLDDKKFSGPNMAELALMISKVLRSQLASLVGNIIVVIPSALVIAFLWEWIFGTKLVSGMEAQDYLNQQNPLTSLCWLYAAIAGVFLFLSGIISGYFENYMIHGKVAQRIREHPVLQNILKKKQLDKIATYLENNIGMLSGNFFLGFFLGFAGFIGHIFGIPFDIRHVTFSAANVAFGLYGLNFQVPFLEILWIISGILLIGIFNLLVSFSLAFYVAVRSRGVKFKDYKKLMHCLKKLFLRYPLDFVWAPGSPRRPENLL
jgi:site-specific recombinase